MKAAEDIVKNFKGNAPAWRKTERGKSENKNNKDVKNPIEQGMARERC